MQLKSWCVGQYTDITGTKKCNDDNVLQLKTNVPNLYACGDCTGGILQISKAVYEGMVAGMTAIKNIK